ncbi:MAG: DNA-binding protein [Bacteriovoracaceae bacterium]|nr:DNA-binding protein [Bacteriovoracaceae bacterium]
MKNKKLTREDIFEVAFKLEKAGIEPSSKLIREEVGSGSLTTITKYLKEWQSGKQHNRSENIVSIPDILGQVDNELLKDYFSNELPQVTALIFSYLSPERAAEVLKEFEPSRREKILSRMENIGYVQTQTVQQIALTIMSEFNSVILAKGEKVGGKSFVKSIRKELAKEGSL